MNKSNAANPAEGVQPDAQQTPQADVAKMDPSSLLDAIPQQKETPKSIEESAAKASEMLLDRIIGERSKETGAQAKPQKQKHHPEKKDAEQGEDDSNAAEKQEAKAEEKAQKPKQKPRKTASEIASEAAAAAAAETARRMQDGRDAALMEQQEKAKPQVPKELEGDIARLRRIQSMYPDEYSGRDLAAELVEAARKESEYERRWRKENPGVEFDWEDDEHSAFVQENAVDVDEEHLRKLDEDDKASKLAEHAKRKVEEEYGDDLKEVRKARIDRELAPVYKQANDMYARTILDAVRPDLVDKLGNGTEVMDAINDDPIASEAISTVERWAIPAIQTAIAVTRKPDSFRQDSQEVRSLVNVALHAERIIASIPDGQRPPSQDGRVFATLGEYRSMRPDQQRRHYTIADESLLPEMIIVAARQEASLIKDRAEKIAASYAKQMGFGKMESKTSQNDAPRQAANRAPSAPSVKASIHADTPEPERQTGPDGVPNQFWRSLGLPK